nr:MAG TPA: hypothetical protein [Caudoviricetes sp.]
MRFPIDESMIKPPHTQETCVRGGCCVTSFSSEQSKDHFTPLPSFASCASIPNRGGRS